MPKLFDRVKETVSTTGTGAYSMGGAQMGHRAVSAAYTTGDTLPYCCENGTDWEVGIGTATAGAPWTVARTTLLASSNGGAAVSWSAGPKNFFCTAPVALLDTHSASGKATPIDADELSLLDSAAGWMMKKLTWAGLKTTLKTYFDTLYAGPSLEQNSKSANYTTVLADANRHLLHPSADTAARTFTIAANSAVAYPVGTAITFVNQSGAGALTVAINTDTLCLAGSGTTGSRVLAANGLATALKITVGGWIISGVGLT